MAMTINITIHSILPTFRKKPPSIAMTVASTCIRALCSRNTNSFNPFTAYLKLLSLFLIENFLFPFISEICFSEVYYETVPVISILILHFPPMIFADGTDDGKPQAVAFYFFRRTVEAVEDLPPVQRRLVGRVRYGQFPARHGEVDFASRPVVADGIDHKVVHEAFQ